MNWSFETSQNYIKKKKIKDIGLWLNIPNISLYLLLNINEIWENNPYKDYILIVVETTNCSHFKQNFNIFCKLSFTLIHYP